jgi:Bifunctional DNA primase/polymerase, N-terminal
LKKRGGVPSGTPTITTTTKIKSSRQPDLQASSKQLDPDDIYKWHWPTSGPNERYALAYANDHRPVFPCKPWPGPNEKAPLTDHGHLDATRDFPTISTWWKRWPNALIGSPVPEGEVCLDIDPRKAHRCGSWRTP